MSEQQLPEQSNTAQARRRAEEVVARDDATLVDALLADAIGHLADEIDAIHQQLPEPYSREEALAKLVEIAARQGRSGTREEDHLQADAVLLRLIRDIEISDAYAQIDKWYA